MSVVVSSGGRRIVASGEAFLFTPNSDLSIDINEDGLQLKLTMRFLRDCARDLSISYERYDGRLFMFCYNFGPEAGPKEPRPIQETNSQKVYIMFRYFEVGYDKDIRSVKYTIFAEQKDG